MVLGHALLDPQSDVIDHDLLCNIIFFTLCTKCEIRGCGQVEIERWPCPLSNVRDGTLMK